MFSARNICTTHLLRSMSATQATFLFCIILQIIFTKGQKSEPEPNFFMALENQTVTQGRDVSFTCVVNHLSSYKVAWIKSDTKAILAIHTNMIAQNPRLKVTHNGHNTWKLHIENVQKNDSGIYMCQINTDPMRSQMGVLEVVVPPDILPENESDGTGVASEGGNIRLRCKATGIPEPKVLWRREDGGNIVLRHDGLREKQVLKSYDGEVLNLVNVHRTDMGAYLCIANNGIPPRVSKRFDVIVHFEPLIRVSNQLVAAPLASDVLVQCYVEASPKAMNHWIRDKDEKLIPSEKYSINETYLNDYSLQMNLTIRNLEKRDFGSYRCISVNAVGRTEGTVRLQELHLPVKSTSTVSTPKLIDMKPRKPLIKEKPKKYKQSRKKENNDMKSEEDRGLSTLFVPEMKTSAPTFPNTPTSTHTPSWTPLQGRTSSTNPSGSAVVLILIHSTYKVLLYFKGFF